MILLWTFGSKSLLISNKVLVKSLTFLTLDLALVSGRVSVTLLSAFPRPLEVLGVNTILCNRREMILLWLDDFILPWVGFCTDGAAMKRFQT